MGLKKNKKPALTVRFNEEEISIHNFEPYSFEEGFLIWYTPDDEAEFRDRNEEIFRSMSKMTPDEMEEKLGETTRGLETRMAENAQVASKRIRRSIAAVKAMQQLQARQAKGIKPDAMANAYGVSAASAAHDAQMLGRLDAAYVVEHVRPSDYVPEIKPFVWDDRRAKMMGKNSSSKGSVRKLMGSSRRMLTRAFSKKTATEMIVLAE
jgi:hypothetical protein